MDSILAHLATSIMWAVFHICVVWHQTYLFQVRHGTQSFPREIPGEQCSAAGDKSGKDPATNLMFQTDQEQVEVQPWSLVCDVLLSRGIEPGTVFQLRQGDVLLLCEVVPLPHFTISEQVLTL